MTASTRPSRAGQIRWIICALLFFAATVNYVDRQIVAILKPTLQHQFGWTETDYGDIVFAFQLAYAIGLALAGRLIEEGAGLPLRDGLAAELAHLVEIFSTRDAYEGLSSLGKRAPVYEGR